MWNWVRARFRIRMMLSFRAKNQGEGGRYGRMILRPGCGHRRAGGERMVFRLLGSWDLKGPLFEAE